jgi:hypothetical protein
MYLAKFLRRIAIGLFWLTSAYLLLMLLIALSDQGEPTGAVSANNPSQLLYPAWYANEGLIGALKLAALAYPAAAIVFGLGSLIIYSASKPDVPPRTMPPSAPTDEDFFVDWPPATPASGKPAASPALDDGPPHSPGRPDPIHPQRPDRPDDLCILDSGFVLRSVGRHAAALLGASTPEMLVRRPFTAFMFPEEIPALRAAVAALQHDPQATIILPLTLRHPDDIAVEAEAICRAGLGPDGQVISLELRPRSTRGSIDDQLTAIWY